LTSILFIIVIIILWSLSMLVFLPLRPWPWPCDLCHWPGLVLGPQVLVNVTGGEELIQYIGLVIQCAIYGVYGKKETEMFGDSHQIWYTVSRINLLQKCVNVFHLTWMMSLHYLVMKKTWNSHHAGATTALSEKETPQFIPSQLWPPNCPDLNPVDYNVWEYCKRRCTKQLKIRITDLDELKTATENGMDEAAWIT